METRRTAELPGDEDLDDGPTEESDAEGSRRLSVQLSSKRSPNSGTGREGKMSAWMAPERHVT